MPAPGGIHNWAAVHELPFPDRIACVESFVGTTGGAFTLSFPNATVLAANPGCFTYLTHLTISCPQVGVVTSGLITLTGGGYRVETTGSVINVTVNHQFVETVSAGGMWDAPFKVPLISTGLNTPIVLNVPAIGGGSAIAAIMIGYLS